MSPVDDLGEHYCHTDTHPLDWPLQPHNDPLVLTGPPPWLGNTPADLWPLQQSIDVTCDEDTLRQPAVVVLLTQGVLPPGATLADAVSATLCECTSTDTNFNIQPADSVFSTAVWVGVVEGVMFLSKCPFDSATIAIPTTPERLDLLEKAGILILSHRPSPYSLRTHSTPSIFHSLSQHLTRHSFDDIWDISSRWSYQRVFYDITVGLSSGPGRHTSGWMSDGEDGVWLCWDGNTGIKWVSDEPPEGVLAVFIQWSALSLLHQCCPQPNNTPDISSWFYPNYISDSDSE